MIKINVRVGEWYSNKKLKQIMKQSFLDVNIKTSAKASSICEYYEVRDKQVRVMGVQTDGKLIIKRIK